MDQVITLSFVDENSSGKVLQQIPVSLPAGTTTVRDIIEARVRQEVAAYNRKRPDYYNGLIEPTDAEKTVNGFRLKRHKEIDAEKQVYVALDAFQKNGFFVLADNKQCDSLDDQLQLSGATRISFIKLTPLVGG